ncbi:MAG: response regulator [Candidatus Zixiibacteriota bacterium]
MRDPKILIVDDSPTMRRIIINCLKRAGFTNFVEACDGKDALAKLQVEDINLMVTDWNMPEMDGLTLVTAVRGTEQLKNLPIVMVTMRSVKEDIVEAMKAGVDGYIIKPFRPDTLIDKLRKILSPVASDDKKSDVPG